MKLSDAEQWNLSWCIYQTVGPGPKVHYLVVQWLIIKVMGFVDMSEAVPGSAASVFSHGLIVVGAARFRSAQ